MVASIKLTHKDVLAINVGHKSKFLSLSRTKVLVGLRKMLAAKEHAQAIQFVASCRRSEGPAA